jgi:hypothetical protein
MGLAPRGTGTTVTKPAEVVGALPGPLRYLTFPNASLRRIQAPNHPVSESTAGRIRIVDKYGDLDGFGRKIGPGQRRNQVLSVTGIAAGYGAAVGEGVARETCSHCSHLGSDTMHSLSNRHP